MRHGCHLCIAILSIIGLLGTAQAAPTYSGSLSYSGGGITGITGNPWLADGTTFRWEITDNGDGTYTYTYRLQVPDDSKGISHMTVEVSESFESDDILPPVQGTLADDQPDDYPKGGSDPGMPSPMHGIKFEGGGSEYDWTVSFASTRAPVWGDFYAKGGQIAIWNAGFTDPDSDPANPPGNTSVDNHVLVPDTTTNPVPMPGALLLCSLGLTLVGYLRGRHYM